MTQKQAIQNILNTLDYTGAKVMFISLWLEDINWHSENAKFCEAMKYWVDEINDESAPRTDSQKHSLKAAQECVRGVNYIYGWGIDHNEWETDGVGGAFVEELLDMVKNPKDTK